MLDYLLHMFNFGTSSQDHANLIKNLD